MVALHEILLAQRLQLARSNEVSTFKGACSGEGPAGAAPLLVLHWGHSTLGDPIDRISNICDVWERHLRQVTKARSLFVAKVGGCKLIPSQVGKLVEAQPVGLGLVTIMLLDDVHICLEGTVADLRVFSVCGVVLVEVLSVLDKLFLARCQRESRNKTANSPKSV